jgi:hypothetical protein
MFRNNFFRQLFASLPESAAGTDEVDRKTYVHLCGNNDGPVNEDPDIAQPVTESVDK